MSTAPQIIPDDVFVIAALYGRDPLGPRYTILWRPTKQVFINVNKYILQALRDGSSPEDLDLIEAEEDEDY